MKNFCLGTPPLPFPKVGAVWSAKHGIRGGLPRCAKPSTARLIQHVEKNKALGSKKEPRRSKAFFSWGSDKTFHQVRILFGFWRGFPKVVLYLRDGMGKSPPLAKKNRDGKNFFFVSAREKENGMDLVKSDSVFTFLRSEQRGDSR